MTSASAGRSHGGFWADGRIHQRLAFESDGSWAWPEPEPSNARIAFPWQSGSEVTSAGTNRLREKQ
jgi:hypothetical protein